MGKNALLNHEFENSTQTSPSHDSSCFPETKQIRLLHIARSKIKNVIAQKVDCAYAESSKAKVQLQIKKTIVDTLKRGSSAAEKKIKIAHQYDSRGR